MQKPLGRVVVLFEISAKSIVRKNIGAKINAEHRTDVGVHHEAREREQSEVEIVGATGSSAFGVIDRDNAVDIWELGLDVWKVMRHGAREGGCAGICAKNNDVVARAGAASCVADKTAERRMRRGSGHLLAGTKVRCIKLKRQAMVEKVRRVRKLEIDVPFRQRTKDFLVADVFPGLDVARRETERQSPGKERLTFADAENGEAVSFKNCVCQFENKLTNEKTSAGRKRACGDGNVIAGRWDTPDLSEIQRFWWGGDHQKTISHKEHQDTKKTGNRGRSIDLVDTAECCFRLAAADASV